MVPFHLACFSLSVLWFHSSTFCHFGPAICTPSWPETLVQSSFVCRFVCLSEQYLSAAYINHPQSSRDSAEAVLLGQDQEISTTAIIDYHYNRLGEHQERLWLQLTLSAAQQKWHIPGPDHIFSSAALPKSAADATC
ncbi:hypothetical protein F5883DRAFT_43801 [Diaporthe sp. PMI_573]|nr:hypothetical protein F5883DRAFT_43801 [Diaporthaceae sp. PMI_573]